MSTLVCTLQGRTGNQAMQWLFAYAYAKKHGMTFECEEWIGERIWDLPPYGRPSTRCFPRVNELTITPTDCEYRGYAQMQSCMIYTKREAQSWLHFNRGIEKLCIEADYPHRPPRIVCHFRRGDYFGYGYPVVAKEGYLAALDKFGFEFGDTAFLSDDFPSRHGALPDDLSFVADFHRMVKAPTLLRANSSFSWLAGLLSNGIVLSPRIDGLAGGIEHSVKFEVGNHCKLSDHDFCTDLHVAAA